MAHFGGGGGGGHTQLGVPVYLNLYDLAPGPNQVLFPLGLGLHHSGIEVLGTEYSFASGGSGIFDMQPPKVAPGAVFRTQLLLGHATMAAVNRALDELRSKFGPTEYHLLRKNCNHFCNALSIELLNKPIPGYVNRLALLGQCCDCLLPQQRLEHAPVGDSSTSGFSMQPPRGGGGGGGRHAPVTPATMAFRGAGHTLGSSSSSSRARNEASSSSALLSRWTATTTSSTAKDDTLTDRREKARKAALARLEQQRQSSPNNVSDRSR